MKRSAGVVGEVLPAVVTVTSTVPADAGGDKVRHSVSELHDTHDEDRAVDEFKERGKETHRSSRE